MSKTSSSSSGIGFTGLLTIVFIVLKLLNITVVATWSWWWVLSPIWISACVIVAVVFLLLVIESKKKQIIEPEQRSIIKSKFMEKLNVAMKENERIKQQQISNHHE